MRIGLLGRVGRFTALDGLRHARGTEVVCRTERGLEVGRVLSHVEPSELHEPDGTLLRRLAVEDRLLVARLEKNRNAAFEACQRLLEEEQIPATLVDVEQLFDAQSIYFYFLGDVPSGTEQLVSQLTEVYEAEAMIGDFAAAVEHGCGPDCGTESAEGCGSGGCSTCAAASACKVGRSGG